MFKPKGLNRNYLQLPEFKVNIARQVKQRQNLSKNFSSKKWRKNTKVLAEAKKFKDFIAHEPIHHKTSIGRNPSKCKMNKQKRRQFKAYKGQGK